MPTGTVLLIEKGMGIGWLVKTKDNFIGYIFRRFVKDKKIYVQLREYQRRWKYKLYEENDIKEILKGGRNK